MHHNVVGWPCDHPAVCLVSIDTLISMTLIIIIRQQAFETPSWNTFYSLFPSKLTLPRTEKLLHTHTHTTETTTVGVLGNHWETLRGMGYALVDKKCLVSVTIKTKAAMSSSHRLYGRGVTSPIGVRGDDQYKVWRWVYARWHFWLVTPSHEALSPHIPW